MHIDSLIHAMDRIDADRDLIHSARQRARQARRRAPGQGREGVPGSKVILNRVENGSHL